MYKFLGTTIVVGKIKLGGGFVKNERKFSKYF